ncbi:carboxymuconolactone decarboxylase family protein [Streptomyces sp. AC536]|uniref:carboxymuconolactone decarboxylase family protein n=1 Tax=Streptomyces buecherae TaxID=2763006 RepID=UPI00164D1C67|nr:carboxymuconolactone decarboxylase family protein [Streptomyces buecherae]MBC3983214.1 carboxymuconolactone decarboxylase family protein [Streptomyces buecherae]QNJ43182.1 carboxymuconolactone decarboxylase family protein [Streptomyces buecherae]
MQPRMENVYKVAGPGYQALAAMEEFLRDSPAPDDILELVRLRVSQINGCSLCVDMHAHRASDAGETNERLWSVAAWRDTPFFTDRERAALALAEAVTRIADNPEGVPDDVWDTAADHFAPDALAALVMAIASINAWNRVNVAARLVAGSIR